MKVQYSITELLFITLASILSPVNLIVLATVMFDISSLALFSKSKSLCVPCTYTKDKQLKPINTKSPLSLSICSSKPKKSLSKVKVSKIKGSDQSSVTLKLTLKK